MSFLHRIPVLHGSQVRLEPLSARHAGDLAVASEEDRSTYGFTVVPRAWQVEEYLTAHSQRADDGLLAPFAQVRLGDDRAVGVTAYWDPRRWPGRQDLYSVDIGWTWLAASAQRTGINTEAKLLLLGYAFETLGVVRVGFRPTLATSGPGAPSGVWGRASRGSCATGRPRGHPVRAASFVTPRSSR